MGRTRAVVREAEAAVQQVAAGTVRAAALAQFAVEGLAQQLRQTTGLVRRVLAQTRARVLQGNTHYPDKLLSLFEPHTEAIRKGKAVKPTEFGKLVKIQEAMSLISGKCAIPDSRRLGGTKPVASAG
jgi:IS5 family transposase